ncbi:MAG: hypothetical protein DMF64_00695 [Acidobacteria bacterium]|nr:MAG: hypothetical protein DMF64_00695 [Acidobacteriota bacterium]
MSHVDASHATRPARPEKRSGLFARGRRDKVFRAALARFGRKAQGEMFEAAGVQTAGAARMRR